jgi:speckle-type POZ protein
MQLNQFRINVIPDCYFQPQTVWVSVDGGKFEIDYKKITKIILKKVENVSLLDNTERSWNSEQVEFTPQHKERFTFKFFLQFKIFRFNQMNAIVKQTTDYLFLQQTNCDVHFRFQRTSDKIGAHRCILSARSPVFAAMFQHNMQESKTGEVMIQEIEKDIFYQFLHFIYSGETSDPLTETTAQQLLAAAVKYNIQDLKDECASFLLPYVSETTAQKMFELADAFHVKNLKEECENILLLDIQMNNVLNLIIWADLHSAEDVKEAALNFARANSETLFQSDDYEKMMREYPDICLEATRHMTCSSVLQLRLKRLKSLLMQSDSD